MKVLAGMMFILALSGIASAQSGGQQFRWDTTMVSAGVGTTILPTPVLAAQRVGDGGAGFIGGNVTIGARISREIGPHWRIPISLSLAFFRGSEQFWSREVVSKGDTIGVARILSTTSNVISVQAGIEYIEHHELISPYLGVDFGYNNIGVSTLEMTIPALNETVLSQSLPTSSRFGAVLRAGAEFPLFDRVYYDVSAELGAFNLLGRESGDKPSVGQLFVPTQEALNQYASRNKEGKTGEAVVTFFRILLKAAWKI